MTNGVLITSPVAETAVAIAAATMKEKMACIAEIVYESSLS